MTFSAVSLLLGVVGSSALAINATESQKIPQDAMRAMKKLQATAKFAFTMQNRRLQEESGITSEGCVKACPKVGDMWMDAMTAQQDADGTEDEQMAALLQAMCKHRDTLQCVGKEAACKSEDDDGSGLEAIACMCECPDLMALGGAEDAGQAMCDNQVGIIHCMLDTDSCSSMTSSMTSGADAATIKSSFSLSCESNRKGCDEKSSNMETCAGDDVMKKWADAECMTSPAETCCPMAETIATCLDKECMKIMWAMQKISADSGDADAKASLERSLKISNTCPSTGLPKSMDEVQAVTDAHSGEPPAASGASQMVPAFAMAATAFTFFA